jgi:hypothetical protein
MRDEGVHPTEAVLLDVLDGVAEGQARKHVAACAECAARVEEARQGLALASQADVPEPSPLYWEDFRSQVGRRISVERRSRRMVLAPLAAAAVLAGAIAFLPRGDHAPSSVRVATLPAWSALPPEDDDPGFGVLLALVGRTEELATTVDCRGTEDCLADLSDEESRAVADLLGRELGGGGRR